MVGHMVRENSECTVEGILFIEVLNLRNRKFKASDWVQGLVCTLNMHEHVSRFV